MECGVAGGTKQGRGKDTNLEDHFGGMNLHGEQEEDLDLSSGDIKDLIDDTRLICIFKVLTQKPFSHVALSKEMCNAWSSAQGDTFKSTEDIIFLDQFLFLGDWSLLMDNDPWLFRDASVIIEEYGGITDVHQYKLNTIHV